MVRRFFLITELNHRMLTLAGTSTPSAIASTHHLSFWVSSLDLAPLRFSVYFTLNPNLFPTTAGTP